jgi:lysozyme
MAISSDKLLNRPSELHRRYGGRLAMKEAQQKRMIGGGPSNIVLTKKSTKDISSIKVNVIKIESILKGTLASEKKELDSKKRAESGKRREKQEEKLETKPQAEKGPIKMPKIPRMGFLDWVKNFIGNVILGYFAVRLIDYLPKIKPIIKFLGSAVDFIIDVGGKLLNGLVTFVDWGYKAIDFTRGMMKSIGGENFAKVFDGFTGAVGTLVETAIIAAAIIASQGGDGGATGPQRPGRGGRPQVTTSGGGTAGRPDIRNPLRQRPTVTTGQGGKPGGVNIPGTGPKVTGSGGGPKLRLPKGLKARGGLLGLIFLIPDLISSGMLVSQGRGKDGLRTLLSAVSGVVAGMGAYAATLGAAAALGITGVGLPAAIGLAVAGLAASSAAGMAAYNLADLGLKKMGLVDKDPKTGKPYAYRSGGITRGGKRRTSARRTVSKGGKRKYKRVVPRKPGEVEIKPGADVGGEEKIFGIFPNPLKAAQRVVDAVNPFAVVKTAGEDLGKTDYFGPILAITSKITLGQKPSQRDYENVGLGINMLIAKGIQDKQLKGGIIASFAEGGLVDPDVLSAAETGGDISNWVAKTFQGEIESNAQKTLRMIRENAQKKKTETSEETPPSSEIETESGTSGDGTADTSMNPNRRAFLDTLAFAEGTSKYPNTGYNTMFTGKQFTGFKDHPRKLQVSGRYRSDAAGRYQFLSTTWDGLGLPDFSPANQDKGALKLLAPHVLQAIDKGDFATAFHGARKTWASLPGAGYGQPEKKMKTLVEYANNRVQKYKKGEIGKPVMDDISLKDIGSAKGYRVTRSGATIKDYSELPAHHTYQTTSDGRRVQDFTLYKGNKFVDIPVPSPVTGKVTWTGPAGGGGNWVEIQSKDGKVELGHFNRITAKVGQDVQAFKSVLGLQGYTGNIRPPGPDGTHVHIQAPDKIIGRYVNTLAKGSAFHGESVGIVPKGGMRLTLHEGEMYKVIDKDSVKLLGFDLAREVINIENQSQLIAKSPSIIEKLKSISGYASYDAMSAQTIIVPQSNQMEDEYDSNTSGGTTIIPVGGGSDPFESLYQGW